jgi:DNA-binding beta-propeller fold protein YncE
VVLADTFAYVSTMSSGTVIEINTRSYAVVGFGLARNPANGRLYVSTSYFGRAVHEIDPVTRTIVRTIATDGSPRRIAFDATGSLALVTNESGWIDVIR